MSVWIWAALACLVSGLVLVMPKQEEELPPGGLELRPRADPPEHDLQSKAVAQTVGTGP